MSFSSSPYDPSFRVFPAILYVHALLNPVLYLVYHFYRCLARCRFPCSGAIAFPSSKCERKPPHSGRMNCRCGEVGFYAVLWRASCNDQSLCRINNDFPLFRFWLVCKFKKIPMIAYLFRVISFAQVYIFPAIS